ncbi:hypothetical protein E4U32_001035 [Claviceps aff. humidiphila group G2b]|nr:hypothetical protein E4U32_001035 [Claviceps aff. humidiphila group G2b]
MDHRFDPTGETNEEERSPTALIQATLIEAEVPKRLRKYVKRGFFSARWKRAHEDINHGAASTIDANDRVAFFIRDSIDEGLTDMDLGIRFRDDFGSWGEKSFDLLSPSVQEELRDFLRERRALSDYGFNRKIAPFLAEVVETETPEETEWRRLMAIRHERQRQRSRRTPSFLMHTQQQARPAPGGDPQPSHLHRQQVQCAPSAKIQNQQARSAPRLDSQLSHTHRQQQFLPTVIRSLIPPTYEKNLPILREPSLQYCSVPTQSQPVHQEKLLLPQLLHETPMPTPRTDSRPTLLHQDSNGNPHVKTTTGSHHKLKSTPVHKAVTESVNNTLAEPRHDTSGDNEEEHSSDPLKSAAARPFDDSSLIIPAVDPHVEPEQRPDEPLDKGAPANEQEFVAAHYEDSADVEEFDGPIDDRKRKEKETLRGEFSPAIYVFSPDKGSSWMPPALKLLMTPPAPKCLMTPMALVNHFLADFEKYFRLVERLVP